jgi:hypothetical protein
VRLDRRRQSWQRLHANELVLRGDCGAIR